MNDRDERRGATGGRRLPIGAELRAGTAHFRVWAPDRQSVAVVIHGSGRVSALQRGAAGYFEGSAEGVSAGSLYSFRLDSGDTLIPDPASRFQPQGPAGPSMLVDPGEYRWQTAHWPSPRAAAAVMYEMHIGTFTHAGTWEAARHQLPNLAELGISILEIMPVAEFAGEFGWGYDGVDLFAPTRLYGSPDDMRAFVDEAHGLGLCVILDVVYNHLGPDGNNLTQFAKDYFTAAHRTDWGDAVNFDSAGVREFVLSNARYWIGEFRLDGLRLDATQDIHDAGRPHILAEIADAVRVAANGRDTLVVAENEPQQTRLVRPREVAGYGIDMLWNDDFHHSAMVALTGRHEAYYSNHRGAPQEFISAAKYGYLFQGQYYSWQQQRRGTPAFDLTAAVFVNFLQNHDQVANSAAGMRCHQLAAPGTLRAMTALLLLMPGTPLLFQGQEFAASSPFLYFADHKAEVAAGVSAGRAAFLAQFPSLATPEAQAALADPADRTTFQRSKLPLEERDTHGAALRLHRDLIRLRRDDALSQAHDVDGAVLGPQAFVLRYFTAAGDRLLLVNLGSDFLYDSGAEPLLSPWSGRAWAVLWSSEHPRYGGCGTPELDTPAGLRLPGRSAVLLLPLTPAAAAEPEEVRP